MKPLFLSLILFTISCRIFSQTTAERFRDKGWQTLVFKITAAEAEQFFKWDSIPLKQFENREPDQIFSTGWYEDSLANGLYVTVFANGIYADAEIICISDLVAVPVNNKKFLQIDVRNKNGEWVNNAKVNVNGKDAALNRQSNTFEIRSRKLDDAFVKIYAPSDTLYLSLSEKDDDYIKPLSEQRRQNYRNTKLYKVLTWIPSRFKRLFTKSNYKSSRMGAYGYMVFNQPKYKPLDTVKFKGYVLGKNKKQYKKEIEVILSYMQYGKNVSQFLYLLQPVSDGAYTGQFVLADSIPMDIHCRLQFKTKDKKEIINGSFKTEDYLLDEIATYTFKSSKEVYLKNDSLHFFARAKDANGLNVMDGKASLILTTFKVDEIQNEDLLIPDTLYQQEIPLDTKAETRFSINSQILPKANITIDAKLVFTNSNNETHEEVKDIQYKYYGKKIIVTLQQDSLIATYFDDDGKSLPVDGEISFNDEAEKPIRFPVRIKINPLAEDYSFYVFDSAGKIAASESYNIDEKYSLNFSRISKKDTMGFALYNPYRIPVYYTVLHGKKTIASGKDSAVSVQWQTLVKNPRHSYKVRWQFFWGGKENQGEENIALLYQLLTLKLTASNTVFPGQKDSLKIEALDYKGNPANHVNLTALSYNNQFSKDIRVPEPPYIAKYTGEKYLQYPGFEKDDDNYSLEKKYLLGSNTQWVKKLHIDTIPFYRLLLPGNPVQDEAALINNITPQVSVQVVQKGIPQEIYLLYINKELVYYNGVTDKMKYAFEVFPANVHLGIRLKDKYVEIDSLYIQPNYKHDLSFDLDNLPPHSSIINAENYWSYYEMNLLERSIWQMRNDELNNNAYIWQNNRLVHLSGNRTHTAGPFKNDSLTFYNPGKFDIKFNFESGYQYSLSKKVARLEKHDLFADKKNKIFLPSVAYTFKLGDTMLPLPEINYISKEKEIFLRVNNTPAFNPYASKIPFTGSLYFTKPADSSFRYLMLEPMDTSNQIIVLSEWQFTNKVKNIIPGIYNLLLVTTNNSLLQVKNISIQPNSTTCIKANRNGYFSNNLLLEDISDRLWDYNKVSTAPKDTPVEEQPRSNEQSALVTSGGTEINGTVMDKKGKLPVAGATVKLQGYSTATVTGSTGNFILKSVKPGKYILVIGAVGYQPKELSVNTQENNKIVADISLDLSVNHLDEVVVVGYGSMKMKSITGSITTIKSEELTYQLQGRAAGVSIIPEGAPGSSSQILLRGVSSFADNNPLYVVDGILYDEFPKNLDASLIQDISILKDASAVSIYGSRAVNGVVIITLKTKTFRQTFRDYALWYPNFFTDKNGQATIPIQYPDNITSWKTFVLGMDKKNRMGKTYTLTQAYKPLVAELSLPQFLIEGDEAVVVGKSKNYTNDKYNLETTLSVNENIIKTKSVEIAPASSDLLMKTIQGIGDTLIAAYSLNTTTGFKDGEERKIPVLKQGTEESIGSFWVLGKDTAVTVSTIDHKGNLILYAQNNTIDLLLEELDHLKKYPYFCMEQTASKLKGLPMEKMIRKELNQSFAEQKEFDRLLQKIQKAQQFDGGWAWWENGKSNFYISNYIAGILQDVKELPLVETNVRNAFLYLQNQLATLKKDQLLAALVTLSAGKHELNYSDWLKPIHFDSLTQHQQWQYVSILQQQGLDYSAALKKLVNKKRTSVLGSTYWGENNYKWYSNDIATTIIAYKVFKNDNEYRYLCTNIIQYFLEKRKSGYWANTVESASIINTILPDLLLDNKQFPSSASVQISGDTSFVINSFPYKVTCSERIKNIHINKRGSGLTYVTAYQNFFNASPKPEETNFIVHTSFKQDKLNATNIKAGKKTTMLVTIEALQDAEFIQLEIPIPAGCTYSTKPNSDWKVNREYYKNKAIFFTENLPKGTHHFEIELETRYVGNYTLNPAKISLMYFPIFYGRNGIKKIIIE